MRLQIAARAQRTLDVQYLLFRQDDTGQLLLGALLAAADRGVRVRLLVDDAEMVGSPSLIRLLAANPNIEIQVFNPFAIREAPAFLRWAEFIAANRRLNYRMHNMVLIGDNAIAVTRGGTLRTVTSRRARR